jgi:uncharacterized cysteine cluster protein YcgN (CxxCxxCC family)
MSKVYLELGIKTSRTCEGCTKCCEGWLYAEIDGQELTPGSPCQFVKINVGCSIYEERPQDPCRTFQCLWKTSESVPKEFSPKAHGVILSKQSVGDIEYLSATYAGNHMNADMFSWFMSYGVENQLNLQWTIEGRVHCMGSIDFTEAMKTIYPEAETIELPRRLS